MLNFYNEKGEIEKAFSGSKSSTNIISIEIEK